jgi:hypothetical protein
MKKIFKIIIGTLLGLFLLWSGFRLFIDYISEGKRFEHISDSVEESKACGAFICEFNYNELDSLTRQELSKYNYLESLDSAQIWLEKGHKYVNQNLYMNKLVFLEKYHLTIQNPRELKEIKDSTLSMKIIKGEYPDFGIRKSKDFELVTASTTKYTSQKIRFGETTEIRNQSGANRHNFFQRISKVTLDEPTDEVEVWIYLPFMTFQVDDIILGKVVLKANGDLLNRDFIDKRNWWERINI